MDTSSIVWKKLISLMNEGENSLKELIKSGRIGFGTVFKVGRVRFIYNYVHFFMILDISDDKFTVGHLNFKFSRGVFFETRDVNYKGGYVTLFDFDCNVYFEESCVLKENEREIIKSRVKYVQSICIKYGFGPNRWDCESIINFIRYGKKRLSNKLESDIFKERFITGPFFLWIVERLATGEYIIARIRNSKKIKKFKSFKLRNCIRDTVCKVPLIVTPSLILPSFQQANSNV